MMSLLLIGMLLFCVEPSSSSDECKGKGLFKTTIGELPKEQQDAVKKDIKNKNFNDGTRVDYFEKTKAHYETKEPDTQIFLNISTVPITFGRLYQDNNKQWKFIDFGDEKRGERRYKTSAQWCDIKLP